MCRTFEVQPQKAWLSAWLFAIGWSGVAALSAAAVAATPPGLQRSVVPTNALKLHVPSPDWRDQVIYFAVTDRFDDADPSNNNQGAGEFNPASNARYSGGDLKGLTRRLDYIQGLGATALWITPPVANQWWDASIQYSGYHGYWAENFRKVDAHLGQLSDYQALSDRLHRAGMYLVQDIVLNHTGNYFQYAGPWDAKQVARNFQRNPVSSGARAPSQWPFSLNDARNPAQRKAGIYHWTPNVTDFTDPEQESNFQMSGLDDLNTENPVVRKALRDSYGYWIKAVGVDAFRLDTAFYVPPAAVSDFLYARDRAAPGIARVAASTGRSNFLVFGEGFGIDKPYEETQARKIETYVNGKGDRGPRGMQGMLNFPLYGTAGDVLARGRPTAELGYRIRSLMQVHSNPHLMPSFVDNHDVDRFLAGADTVALQQNLALIMTLPGVPVIYYGTEQGFTEQRASMFRGGYGSGGQDHFNTQAPLYQYIKRLTQLRHDHRVLSRGVPTVLRDNPVGPGALAYRMDDGRQQALVVFNTAPHPVLLDNLATGLPGNSVLSGVFGLDGVLPDAAVEADSRMTLTLPARSVGVWMASAARKPTPIRPAPLVLDPLPATAVTGSLSVQGQALAGQPLQIVVDGDLQGATAVLAQADGRWQASVATDNMVDPALEHRVVVWAPDMGVASGAQVFKVNRPWQVVADVEDPAGDDTGPSGTYSYPQDVGWTAHRQLDLRRVRVLTSGGSLRLDLTMNTVTTLWNPANGFDHVAFTVFLELPGRSGGVSVMPLQNADLPVGMQWHYRLRAHGWSNALFSSAGAGAKSEGTPVGPAADIRVDRAARTVSFVLKSAALGGLVSLSGAKIYVTTWDYDGGYRALGLDSNSGRFGGGPPTDPLVMDASAVITIP